LAVAVADMGLEPSRDLRRLLRGKRPVQARQDKEAGAGEAGESGNLVKERS
jgi:hypothetical protein